MTYLIDTHAHLDYDDYSGDLERVLERASEAGVARIVSVGFNRASSLRNIALAQRYPATIAATYGVHPHDAAEYCREIETELAEAINSKKIVAVGEIGLDYYRNLSPAATQKAAFMSQLSIAATCKMPVVIHLRDAFEDFSEITAGIGFRGVFHCYSGDAAFARIQAEKGMHFSFTASITYPLKDAFKKAAKTGKGIYEYLRSPEGAATVPPELAETVNAVPADRIMVETDCPYLSPQPLRGKRNEPANVLMVAECLAALRNEEREAFFATTSANAERFFGI